MPVTLPAGKLRKLKMLADPVGRFQMMAVDQRGSVAATLAKTMGVDAKAVTYDDLAETKAVITRTLSPYATAVLTDPEYGYPYSGHTIPGNVAVLLAYEESGYEKAGPEGNERRSRTIEGWSVAKAKRAGADAIKFLVYAHPDASDETRKHQQEIVRRVGEECAEHELPFLLEVVSYSLNHASGTPGFAREKPGLVIRNAVEYSRPEYRVDILKLEFPCELKYTAEYAHGLFDGQAREPVYTLDEVQGYCRRLDEACALPWVILSAGVGIREFQEDIHLSTEAGASGYLCGRAVWKGVLDLYPDVAAMEEHCRTEGVYNWMQCSAANLKALPWFEHRRFGGWDNIRIEGRSPEWHRR
ncbi:MAG: tagatose 1,6-diphosphate aldolase [Armatimonadetes bacterium]|nr:tagatose 1,6-diphosphate aldolase [Armatimonadota bacterium]